MGIWILFLLLTLMMPLPGMKTMELQVIPKLLWVFPRGQVWLLDLLLMEQ
jgi:hypothetical protein